MKHVISEELFTMDVKEFLIAIQQVMSILMRYIIDHNIYIQLGVCIIIIHGPK